MSATLLDGKKLAEQLRTEVARDVALFKEQYGLVPGLAVVLVGEDPASQVYVRNKHKQTIEVGLQSFEHKLPVTTTQDALLELIAELNAAPHVHGILVQLPLPKQIDEHAVIQSIAPAKDVDGFHVVNAGKLATGQPSLVPCTPSGCMKLLALAHKDFSGLHAVVIGRSNIVGKPIAQLLLQANATVTIAHSRTKDMPAMLAQADIVIAALGKPEFVQGAWLKPGCTVIDVGINRITQTDGTHKLVGDVHFENAAERAAFITPVPGGVGPMTIACLLANTLQAAYAIHRI